MDHVRNQFLDNLSAAAIRLTGFLESSARRLPAPIKQRLRPAASLFRRSGSISRNYRRWMEQHDRLTDTDRDQIRTHLASLEYQPLISVIMPVFETPEWALREAISSVRHQLYPNWELCIADDASKAPHVFSVLQENSSADQRIKWMRRETNGHISLASNSALALATGEFIALLDHDDLFAEHALYEIVVALNRNRRLDIIFTDEDQIDAKGRRVEPYFKTDWNIDLLLGQNMVSHLGVYRRELVDKLGGFRRGLEGSQDYDLALRCADASDPSRICHIPAILYHWRRNYGPASFSERKLGECSAAAIVAINDHLKRRGENASVTPEAVAPLWTRVIRAIPTPAPLVSLIVPTRDQPDLLDKCIRGLLERTDYPATEVLIVNHESKLSKTHALFQRLKHDPRVQLLEYSGAFNYSAINNMAVRRARGSIIGLINNDVDVINSEWLSEMVALAAMEDVGAVGAKLFYPNGRVQHGGVVLGVGGVANHFSHGERKTSLGYFGRNVLVSSVSAVTAACMVLRRAVFEEVGGFNEKDLPVAFNDVDLCLRIGQRGYRNIWTPHAQLYHFESATRGTDRSPAQEARFSRETDYMRTTWGAVLEHDPFYNENLSVEIGHCFELAFPPRRKRPWL